METFTVTTRYGYGMNFECFYRENKNLKRINRAELPDPVVSDICLAINLLKEYCDSQSQVYTLPVTKGSAFQEAQLLKYDRSNYILGAQEGCWHHQGVAYFLFSQYFLELFFVQTARDPPCLF